MALGVGGDDGSQDTAEDVVDEAWCAEPADAVYEQRDVVARPHGQRLEGALEVERACAVPMA